MEVSCPFLSMPAFTEGGSACARLARVGRDVIGCAHRWALQEKQHPRGIAWATLYWTVHLEEDKATRQYLYSVASIYPRWSHETRWCRFHGRPPQIHARTLAVKSGKVWGRRRTAVLSSITMGLQTGPPVWVITSAEQEERPFSIVTLSL